MSERPRPPDMDPTTWRFQNMGEAIVRREVEIQRLRGLLARLERESLTCPVCDAVLHLGERHGLDSDGQPCWLAAERP